MTLTRLRRRSSTAPFTFSLPRVRASTFHVPALNHTALGVPDATLQKLSSSAAASYIESLKELNLEYLCACWLCLSTRLIGIGPEAEVFHFDSPASLQRTYAGGGQEEQELRTLARKVRGVTPSALTPQLSTAIATVGERPVIRFSKSHRAARALAQALDEEISNLPVYAKLLSELKMT